MIHILAMLLTQRAMNITTEVALGAESWQWQWQWQWLRQRLRSVS